MQVPETLRYSEEHEWVKVSDGVALIGITDHAQEELGDIVFVELPAKDATVAKGGTLGVVESVKAVSDVYAPVSGTVVEANDRLADNPEVVNTDPYGDGWMAKVRLTDPSEVEQLMTAAQYAAFVAQEKS
jgi:glycine cleavage system H protein